MKCKKCNENEVPPSNIKNKNYICSYCERTRRNNPVKEALCKHCGINKVPPSRLKAYNYTCCKCSNKKRKDNGKTEAICKHCKVNKVAPSRVKKSHYTCAKCEREKYGSTNQRIKNKRVKIIKMLGGCCNYCGSIHTLQVDHKNGNSGDDHLNLTKRNQWFNRILEGSGEAQILCRQCNISKQGMTDSQFKEWIAMMYFKFNPS